MPFLFCFLIADMFIYATFLQLENFKLQFFKGKLLIYLTAAETLVKACWKLISPWKGAELTFSHDCQKQNKLCRTGAHLQSVHMLQHPSLAGGRFCWFFNFKDEVLQPCKLYVYLFIFILYLSALCPLPSVFRFIHLWIIKHGMKTNPTGKR